jgi:SAM-dependent methyltransferase
MRPPSDVPYSCRSCAGKLHPFVDLGGSPLCESFLTADELGGGETFYPLDVQICSECWLAQLQEYVSPERIFSEYAYFSSYSDAWLEHARQFVNLVVSRFGLGASSFIIEIASNDGYLLRNAVARGIPCLGIEPAVNVALAAEAAGVPTRVAFFGRELAANLCAENMSTDLIICNNVLAQVPDLNDFVAGLQMVLRPDGIISLEFPHLLRLIEGNQFDTIYHEHFSYFSLFSVESLLARHGLRVFDAEELWTHGGSLRLFCCHSRHAWLETTELQAVRSAEEAAGLRNLATYRAFNGRVTRTKRNLLEILIRLKNENRSVVAYGAPGKGNTLLNYCGIRTDFIDFTVDKNPYKHGRYLPGTHIPILAPGSIEKMRPDYVLVLPWNLKDEIMKQMAYVRDWGGRFIIPIPEPVIVE